MEILDKITDVFTAFTDGIEKLITRLFGASNERQIRKIGYERDKAGNTVIVPGSLLEQINNLEPAFEKLSAAELKQSAQKFRDRLTAGETLDDLLPEAFAAVRESSKRFLKMRHYDVQMVGGYFLHHGMIAEMVTGEGKTLVATLPSFLNALTGHVHVITVNDYLAQRDMEWMGPVHIGLGLSVGAIQSNMDPDERQHAYDCDVTYGTNNEFGFDYLRDNMKPTNESQVQGELYFALVDEIDNILIDEARTPLIISGPAYDDVAKYSKAERVARQLQENVHFEVKEKEHTCHLSEGGVRKAEELAGVESFYTTGNMEWPHLIDNALRAHHLYKKDVNYVVENGEIVIVDEFTGRKMEGRQWSDGLHQAVEAKEGVTVKEENQTLATITLQNYFKLYKKLAGMTGTAMTEASEFWKIYKLDVISVPTNMPLKRVNHTDVIFRSEKEKWAAVVDEILEVHKTGRPILVGTVSIEKSEMLSNRLGKYGISHAVLNAKHHEKEAEIIAQAGRKSGVTIATNMAGRGTDIILGGNPEHMAWEELRQKYDSRLDVTKAEWDDITNKIAEREGMVTEGREVANSGGLHVIGTERHDSRRIDLQLRGRAGRQGDPGSSRFFLSLEDDLMRLFAGEWVKNMLTRLGMKEGEAIESRMVMKRVEGAQKKVEERHFDQRKNLLEYDEVMDDQRKRIYSYRQRILDGGDCRQLIIGMIEQQVVLGTAEYLAPNYRWETIAHWATQDLGIEIELDALRGMDRVQIVSYIKDQAIRQAEDVTSEQVEVDLPRDAEDQSEWNWLALSRWANARWGLNINDRELKKIGRDEIFPYLLSRAVESIARIEFDPLDTMLEDEFPKQSMCAWLSQQFTLDIKPSDFTGDTGDSGDTGEAVNELILEKINGMYREKEVTFPVSVGIHNFLLHREVSEKQSRGALIFWACDRFGTTLSPEEFRGKSRSDIESKLIDYSRSFLAKGNRCAEKLDDSLDRIYGSRNGQMMHEGNGKANANVGNANVGNALIPQPEALAELTKWANDAFQAELETKQFEALSRDDARQRILSEFHHHFRPELMQAERSLVLEILDTAWKDHLYYMDHLRQGIGLVGYAQKDPKTEYKREGRKAFNSMWERVGQQVTSSIFRLELESPDFVGSLWEITSTQHEDAQIGSDYGPGDGETMYDDDSVPAVETIRNRGPKVGRNDPCPCGSGKKYKKCCGRA